MRRGTTAARHRPARAAARTGPFREFSRPLRRRGGGRSLAAFVVERSASAALAAWFGPRLAAIIAHDGSKAGRAEAMARLEEAVDRDIAALDRLIGSQLDAVLHEERLRRLEGGWRALHVAGRARALRRAHQDPLPHRPLGGDLPRLRARQRIRPIRRCSSRSMRASSARRAASPSACWWPTMKCATHPGPDSPTDDINGLDGLAGVAAAAFAPAAIIRPPRAARLRHLGRRRRRGRPDRRAAGHRPHPLAFAAGARGQPLSLRRAAARPGPRALAGRRDPCRWLPLPRICARPGGARLDQPGLCAGRGGDPRLRQGILAGRYPRRGDRARGHRRRDRQAAGRTPVGRPARWARCARRSKSR